MFSNAVDNAINEQLATPPFEPDKGRRRSEVIMVAMCDAIPKTQLPRKRKRRRRHRKQTLYKSIQAPV